MTEYELEKKFNRAAALPHDGCSLPEPTRGAPPVLNNVGMITIRKRTGKSPDFNANKSEEARFRASIEKLLTSGEIDIETANRMLQ